MNYSPLVKRGVLNAFGVVIYVAVIALFFSNAQAMFGPQDPKGPFIPMMMLLLFVVSALITGSLVLWLPAKLLVDGKKAEAGTLLSVTGGTLVLFLAVIVVILAALR